MRISDAEMFELTIKFDAMSDIEAAMEDESLSDTEVFDYIYDRIETMKEQLDRFKPKKRFSYIMDDDTYGEKKTYTMTLQIDSETIEDIANRILGGETID